MGSTYSGVKLTGHIHGEPYLQVVESYKDLKVDDEMKVHRQYLSTVGQHNTTFTVGKEKTESTVRCSKTVSLSYRRRLTGDRNFR